MKWVVNNAQRQAKMRAHTATHLLHAALLEIFPETKQAGSLVDDDYVRFDYVAEKMLSMDQLHSLAEKINERIRQALPVVSVVQSYQEAVASGAKAFFEDKYGDEVRVVSIGQDQKFSVELCGGTHVSNTSHIWSFVVIEQSWVSSGVKRIVAYTGPKVSSHTVAMEKNIAEIAAKLKAQPQHLDQKVNKMLKDMKKMEEDLSRLQQEQITSVLSHISSKNDKFDVVVAYDDHVALQLFSLKQIATKARDLYTNEKVLLYANDGGFVIVGEGAKQFAKDQGLKWGGSDTFIQGKDVHILEVIKK